MFTSDLLTEGEVYSRNDLREQFNIKDATINTGVFRPAGYQSIWLFVTEQKAADMPQLSDLLEGDTLRWDGQPSGRTDKLIIEHERDGYELLVFYRKHKTEHPKSGFRYEGRFHYKSHRDGQPAHFVLRRVRKGQG